MQLLKIFMAISYGLVSLTIPINTFADAFHFHEYKNKTIGMCRSIQHLQNICNSMPNEEHLCIYHDQCPDEQFCLNHRYEVGHKVRTPPPTNVTPQQTPQQTQPSKRFILVPRESRETGIPQQSTQFTNQFNQMFNLPRVIPSQSSPQQTYNPFTPFVRNTHRQQFRSATIAENPSEDDPYEYNPSEITQELIVDPVSVVVVVIDYNLLN